MSMEQVTDEELVIATLAGPAALRSIIQEHCTHNHHAHKILAPHLPPTEDDVMWYDIGIWKECGPSPIGLCVYHHMRGNGDVCIFCKEQAVWA